MMNQFAVRAEHVARSYQLGSAGTRGDYGTLREALMGAVGAPIRRLRGTNKTAPEAETLWALRDVCFDIQPGEVVGIIGRNGAGKSTLLKILSRITEPTAGTITLRGRVGSLLEVGTGFHAELTGRENIFLNGVILGLKRREIEKQFDAIVEFSGIEQFLDTPVKRYSSGMYVRLAFAVAAHLTTDILIVDEVLAVGDADFQKKCLGKMQNVAEDGRTVLFVSHNMGLVQTLCRRGIYLRDGVVAFDGGVTASVNTYLRVLEQFACQSLRERTDRGGKGDVRLSEVIVTTGDHTHSGVLITGQPARFVFQVTGTVPGISCGFTLYDPSGQPIVHLNSAVPGPEDCSTRGGESCFVCDIEELTLVPGRYRANVCIRAGSDVQDHIESACTFDVEPGEVRGRPVPESNMYSKVCLPHRWAVPVP